MSAFDDEQLLEEDEEMPLTERDLADDAQWKIIQKNTFSRWANEHLKTINKTINDLEADFADGLRLIGLVEVLSGKKFKHVNKRPNFRTQKLENVTMVLEFLERDEGIKIVNIDSGDIVDQRLKLILGLIWTLILHYSISMPMWEGEEPQPQEGGPTPKQRLLNWINNKVPDLPIKNFTTDWNDGKAIGALVDAVAPGLCPDWEDWDPKKAKENAKEAMDAAEKWLDVPQLIKPDEMTNPKVDDLSMMTYLSQFPQAKLKPGAPLRPKQNASRVRAYGPGLEPKGNMVGQQAKFTVETFGAGKGNLELLVLDPKGKQVKCDSTFNKDKKMTYSCVYIPQMEGDFRVIIKFGEKEIAKSPFSVKVEGAAGDASKVTASGPGLEKTGVIVKTKTYFEVYTKGPPAKGRLPGRGGIDAGKGNVDVVILDPVGHKDKIKPTITPSKEGVYLVEYTAMEAGLHSINVMFGGKPIPNSPFGVNVSPASNAKAVYATGRGIQPRGVRVKQHAEFKVHTKGAGTAEVKVQVTGPGGTNIKCEVKQSKTEEGVYECFYIPPKVGQYVVTITFGGQHITKSPFKVDVGPEKTSKIVAFGPGLEGGVVNQPACFTVETNGETGALGFSIEGPSQAKIDCKDNGDGSADVTYWPTAPGEYAVHILCDEQDIPQAPYMAQIQPATTEFDASKVIAKGPGLEKTGVIINKWAEFTVDARKAGKAPLHITCIDANYKPVNVDVKDNKDGTFSCKYNPKNPVKHTIIITWGSVGIPKSPFRVSVSEPTKPGNVKVYGPGVEKGVKTFVKTHFKVDCRTAGPGDVAIALTDDRGKDVPVNTIDNKDGTFTVEYEPTTAGMYTVQVFFAEKEIPASPIKVKVESSIDLSKVTVKGLDTPIQVNEKRTITVVTTMAKKKDAPCLIVVTMPSGRTVELTVTQITEGYSAIFTSTEIGVHTVMIKYAGQDVPNSPYRVTVEKVEITEVTVTGLDTPIPLGETRTVHILIPSTPKKKAPCKVTVTTPKNKTVELPVKDSPDGYTSSFTPTETGPHKVEVNYDKKPVDKSPFTVNVEAKKKTPGVEVKGLETPIQVGETRPVTIVTTSMPKKDAPCKVTVTTPKKKTVDLPVKKAPEGYTTSFTPSETGPHKVEVTYDKQPVPDSPFPVEVVPKGAAVPDAKLPKGDIEVRGLENPVAPGEKRPVTVVTTNAPKKEAPCKIMDVSPKNRTTELKTKKVEIGYEATFSSWDIGIHKVKIEYDSQEVPGSPFEVVVEKLEINKVKVIGLDTPIPLGETRKITIITKETGRVNAVCKVIVTTPKGDTESLPVELQSEGYDCLFTPTMPGKHKVKIEYAGKEVPNSPFTVNVETIDVSKVLVKGLETPIMVGENRPISIITTAVGKEVPCKVTVTTPKNQVSELPTFKTADGHGTSFTPSEIGPHKVTVACAGQDVPGSPFNVMVEKKSLKPVVKGLETPIQVGEKRQIQVIAPTKKEGRFGPEPTCKVFATNPKGRTSELPISVTSTAFETTYSPHDTGTHKIKVEYMEKEVQNSPFSVDVMKPVDVSKVKVKGLETPVEVNEKRPVQIITTETGQEVPCRVTVMNPKNQTAELPTSKTPEGHETTFAPTEVGPHKVMVECAGKEVPGSPFNVQVEKKILRILVKGLDKPIQVGEKRPVEVLAPTKKEGRFAPEPTCKVTMTNPKGKSFELPVTTTDTAFATVCNPRDMGPHKVKVEYNGKEIPDSPFTVDVMKPVDVSKVTVTGLDTPVQVNDKRPVSIITAPVGEEVPCTVTVTNPKNQTAELPLKKTKEGFDTTFAPTEIGPHKVAVECAGKEVPGSPFNVPVEKKVTTITVKGLEKPIQVGEKRQIQILAPVKKEGRFGPEPYCTIVATTPKGRTSELPIAKTSTAFETTYSPHEVGPHTLKIEYMGKDVPGSPFTIDVEKKMDEAMAKVQVLGLDTPIKVGETRPVTVDTQSAGKPDAPCKITATNPKGQPVVLPTKKTPTGFETIFAPLEPGPHMVKVEFAGQEVPKSPFEVPVEPSRAELKGVEVKGLDTPVTVGEKRPITITTGKPDAPCKVTATNPKGRPEDLPTTKTKDGYQATFAPLEVGPYKVKVEYAGKEIPKSPFSVPVEPKTDLSKVEVKGLETPVKVGEKRPISVVTKNTGNPEAPCKVTSVNPKNEPTDCPVKKSKDGYETMFAPLEDGPHVVKVEVAGKEIPKSPFKVEVAKLDLSKVDIKGLEKPVEVDEIRKFTVETRPVTGDAEVPCKVTATNPKGQTTFVPNKKIPEGYECTFTPKETGPHKIMVEYAGHEVPKSPVNVNVEPKFDAKKAKVKGLDTPIPLGESRPISIDTTATGKPDAPCRLFAKGPNSPYTEIPTKKTKEGYEALYTPKEPGPNAVKVELAEKEVSKTPFVVNVEAEFDEKKVEVKGLESPIEVGEHRPVTINTTSTGKPDAPCKVTVTNPKGKVVELPTQKKPEGYGTTFTPTEQGPHKVNVNFAGQEVPRSPFSVDVQPKANVGAVKVKGLETPIEVGENRPIEIDTSSTGRPNAPCRVSVTNPQGKTAELPTKQKPTGYETLFAPLEPGPHLVHVNFNQQEVPKSPFSVKVEPKADVGQVKVMGLETPIEVDEVRPITVDTTAAGRPDAPCQITASNPRGEIIELPTQQIPEGFQTMFAPLEPGPHLVNVNFAGKEVPKSPFAVTVEPKVDVGAVDVLGLETPIKVGEPRPVTVMTSTTGRPDAPCKVKVTNPRGKTMELPTKKIPEGYTATLAPEEVGPHKVNVEFNNKEIPKSPFNVMAEPAIDFSKVKVSGLDEPVEVGEIRPVTVDTAKSGVVDAPCQITATNPVGQVRELPLEKTPTGYQTQFAPLEEGPHLVAVKYAGKEIPKSPFPVSAVPQGPPASKVKAYGPGLERGMATEPAKFTIDTRSVTQPGGLGVTVEGPTESKIECRDNQDGTCDVTYYPTAPGDYNINITYAEEHIPKSPFLAKVVPSANIDVSGVKAYGPGLEPDVFLDSPTGFTVDAKSVTPVGEGKVRAIVTSPSGQRIESIVKNKEDGTYDVLYTPYENGPNKIDITYEDIPIPESPIQVTAAPGCDASRVRAYGPGLEGGFTEEKQVFTVDVKGAGQGGLALAIDGPAETPINCKDNRDGTCEVEYQPVKPGDYDVTIKFADQPIQGSPFHVGIKNPVNPAKVQCYGPGLDSHEVKAGAPATFTVDTTEAGEAPLDVTYTDNTGRTVPVQLVPVAEGKVNATYYPKDEGKCKVDVKFANQEVPNSPFNVQVQPEDKANKVKVHGDGIKPQVLASIPEQFTIDCRETGSDKQPVPIIQRPDGTYIRPMMVNNEDGTYMVQYTPEDTGPYAVNVEFEGKPVPGSPFKTTAIPTGDANKCRITEGLERTVQINKETVITVDASMAGKGMVTCRIRSPSGTEIDINIIENDDGTFSIVFTPGVEGDYNISIKFGGNPVPEGEYCVQAVDEAKYQELFPKVGEDFITPDTVDAVHAAPGLYQPVDFRVPCGPIFNFVTAYIEMPSGKKAYPKIEDNKDGTVTIKYQPQETGLHCLHVKYNQTEIQGSPFQFHVDAINSGFVTAYGPGLSHGVANEPAEFTIVTKDAGAGGLSLAIEGPSKTEIKCKDNEDGTCTVTYLPTAPGEYNITCKFADKHISGSPFVAKVTPGEQVQKAQIGRSSEVSLKVTETDITNLTATIVSPSGHEEPCMLKRLPNGHLGISFTPREVGEHLVNVFRDGHHITNSPFKIYVGESELGNAGKVRVSGKGLEEGMANEVNEFIVDTREAGYGGLSLSIEGPSKADIECHDNEDGTCRVTYKPTEPGTYIINIKFADEHVPGSPFKVKIGGEPSERITERIMRHQQAIDVTHVGSQCELSLKIPGTSPFDMTATVTSPSGITELCDVVSLDDCHYSIKFVPQEMGIHIVSVKHKDMHIPGSPFQFTVGPIAGGGAHKVHAAGLGLVRGEVNEPCEFNIYTREAGAGGLSIAVEGPSKAEVDFEDRKDGSCGVTYTVSEPGEYLVSIKFNDDHIPESPFRVPITPSIGDARKISVSALQNKGLQIGKPCAFVVNFNGAPRGKLQARVVSPSGGEEDALIQEIDDGEYAVRFIPRENGPHLVYVSFDGCQIPDSPFRIQVGTVHADPGMVQAYGDGLRTGKTGQTCKFIVNTVNAGAGALAVTVEGPSKVKLECKEVDDGYEFTYNPTAPGDYLITIRYAGTGIAGSPFKAKIEGPGKGTGFQEQASVVVETVTKTSVMSKFAALPPFVSDASKVTCEGNGLKRGYRNKQCTFNVDTSHAGNNMLFIGMIGPKGPCEELCVKHIPGNPYKISYVVKERGDYMLIVKWGDEQIPGSPFHVRVD